MPDVVTNSALPSGSGSGVRFRIRRCVDIGDADWQALRTAFWNGDTDAAASRVALCRLQAMHAAYFAFIANGENGAALGLAEISVRNEYVNGCETSPVLYLEGLFVQPECRGMGLSRALCRAAEEWGAQASIREFASDAEIGNTLGIEAHLGLGFEEVERVVCFRKPITR